MNEKVFMQNDHLSIVTYPSKYFVCGVLGS